MRDGIVRQKKHRDESQYQQLRRDRMAAASGGDYSTETLLKKLERGGLSLEGATGLVSTARGTKPPAIPPVSKSYNHVLVLNMGDGRFVSIKRVTAGPFLESFSIGIVNSKLLDSATRRGYKSSPTGNRFLVHGVEDLRELPNRKRIDSDMREPLTEVVENFLAGPGKQPDVKELNYSNTPGLSDYLKGTKK